MNFTISNKLNTDDFEKEMLKEIVKVMNQAWNRKIPIIINFIKQKVKEVIEESPEYSELMPGGSLYGQMGYIDMFNFLPQLTNTIANNIIVDFHQFKVMGNQISGGITVSVLRDDFADILSLGGASYFAETGENIPWLSWLLFKGDSKVIMDYRYTENYKAVSWSRTQEGIMLPGEGWGVSSIYSGAAKNNWLTRAIKKLETEFINFTSSLFKA